MSSWKRQAHLWHRWLGIVFGLLVLLWFGSGVVMMYVPYPALTEAERMAWLAPLAAPQVRVTAWDAWRAADRPGMPAAVRLNQVAGRPAYHFQADGRWWSVWADSGQPLRMTAALAADSARNAAPGARRLAAELIDIDQWTFGRVQEHKPLYRVSADDAAGSVLYVSSRTGELVRDTTRSERAWNWAGSVIHWIYFTPLREHGQPWRQVVMWTSAAALLLALLGMVLGILRLRVRRRYAGGRCSPYRGWQAWHHWLGLSIGTLMLTWLFSGWLSVTPFGWLASPGVTAGDRQAFAGGALSREDLAAPVDGIVRAHPGLLELEWRRIGGQLNFSLLDRGRRQLLLPVQAELLQQAMRALRPGVPVMFVSLTSEDDYHYSHHQQAVLPVVRAQFDLADDTTFYIDPLQGDIVGYADRNSKWNRWLFNGLHQLDFASPLRARPVWDVVVIVLCGLGFVATLAGVVLGWRRLARRS
ncbi:PepSY domain-containing protein [Duganella sp. FT94W]|uniref:PepSY domain-containing protein n=1 Tax=Duganella lactea TaxID=2692173 RepID=A0ABW9VCV3_9BURK|nr:PepSY domain-containing protein [Duganella lactea]MYM35432.1 PepSY domain-containing protein [Duganella lactea]